MGGGPAHGPAARRAAPAAGSLSCPGVRAGGRSPAPPDLRETGLFRAGDDYRVPDLAVYRPEHASDRGIDATAEMVVELRSPRDESYDKLDWYAARRVREALIIHPGTRAVERYALRGGAYRLTEANGGGFVTSDVLGVTLATVETPDGPRLRVDDAGTVSDC